MTLFPIIEPLAAQEASTALPLYREIKWDYEQNTPVWRAGNPVLLTGAEAVRVWAWKALQSARFLYEPYSRGYGCELEALVGQTYSDALKRAEAVRYLRECLMCNPYITDVSDIAVDFGDNRLAVSCRLETPYGEVQMDVG